MKKLSILCAVLALSIIYSEAQAGEKKSYTNSIGVEFVLIPSGSFMMGTNPENCKDDPFTEKNEYSFCMRSKDERPYHKVSISKPFYMSRHEITQLQWYQIMGNNPSYYKTENVGMDSRHHPIEQVSWLDVQKFIKTLNQKEKTKKYRLPTEAEWEYAARAGTTTITSCGNNPSCLNELAWHAGNSKRVTHKVGQKKPNAFGLFDIYGNVYEWVLDWYAPDYYTTVSGGVTDPTGPASGSNRVYRGGNERTSISYVRSASRYERPPNSPSGAVGFRLCSD